jgi:hypothetical protein
VLRLVQITASLLAVALFSLRKDGDWATALARLRNKCCQASATSEVIGTSILYTNPVGS